MNGDIDTVVPINEVLNVESMLTEAQKKCYTTYGRKFAAFMKIGGVEGDWSLISAEHLTDDSISKFLLSLGQSCMFKKVHLKMATAMFGKLMLTHSLDNFYSFPSKYPLITRVLIKWRIEQSINPHFVEHAGSWSTRAVQEICGLVSTCDLDLIGQTIAVITSCSAMRAVDLYRTFSKDVTMHHANNQKNINEYKSRNFSFVTTVSKNDIRGEGPISGRTWVVGCFCHTPFSCPDNSDFIAWSNAVEENPRCPCINDCPFNVILDYLAACPDPMGQSRGNPNPFVQRTLTLP